MAHDPYAWRNMPKRAVIAFAIVAGLAGVMALGVFASAHFHAFLHTFSV